MQLLRAGIHFYLIGLIILTLGVAVTILSLLGTSPYDSVLVGSYRTFGLTIGSWEIVVGVVLLLFNAVASRQRPEYFALITSVITGIGIDSWMFLLGDVVTPTTFMGEFGSFTIGFVLMCLGTAGYLQSSIAPIPLDRAMLVVANLTNWNVTYSRALISIVLVTIAFFLSGPIGLGTLLDALFSGLLINLFLPWTERLNGRINHQLERVS